MTSEAPIPLSREMIKAVQDWAADDRLWSTKETTEFNLYTFARLILKHAAHQESPTTVHYWTPDPTKRFCVICGDNGLGSVWGIHRFQIQPHDPDFKPEIGSAPVLVSEASGPSAQERSAMNEPSLPPPSSEPETIAQAREAYVAARLDWYTWPGAQGDEADTEQYERAMDAKLDALLAAVVAQQGQQQEQLTASLIRLMATTESFVNLAMGSGDRQLRDEAPRAVRNAIASARQILAAESLLPAQTPGEPTDGTTIPPGAG